MVRPHELVYKRCGCRDAAGRQVGASCPGLTAVGHGRWYFTVELSGYPDGGRRRLRRGGYPSHRAAAEAARLYSPDRQPGGVDPLIAVGPWLRRWLAERDGIRASTRRSYEMHLRLYLVPYLGRVPLRDLQPGHVRAMFVAIAAEHERRGRTWTPSSRQRLRATLRTALNAAMRERLLTANAARDVELPPVPRPHPVVWNPARVAAWKATGTKPTVAVWTAAQTGEFLRAARADPLYPLFHVVIFRGLRRGEALGLTWPEIDLTNATLTVSQQLLEDNGTLIFAPPKTEASRRTIPLDRATVTVLRRHHREQRQRQRDGTRHAPTGLVFSKDDGTPFRPEYVTRHFQQLAKDAGLPPIRLHDLRHGAASLALAAGTDLKVVQDLLGHSSIVLTADTYTSVLPELARDAAEATARLILAAAKTPPGRRVTDRSRASHGLTPASRKTAGATSCR
jgi:integrase